MTADALLGAVFQARNGLGHVHVFYTSVPNQSGRDFMDHVELIAFGFLGIMALGCLNRFIGTLFGLFALMMIGLVFYYLFTHPREMSQIALGIFDTLDIRSDRLKALFERLWISPEPDVMRARIVMSGLIASFFVAIPLAAIDTLLDLTVRRWKGR